MMITERTKTMLVFSGMKTVKIMMLRTMNSSLHPILEPSFAALEGIIPTLHRLTEVKEKHFVLKARSPAPQCR